MRKFFLVALTALIVVVLFAVFGESLPEGSALRGIADGIRSVGSGIGNAFGGGYGLLPGGGN